MNGMTSLLAWVAKDQRSHSAAYITSDSRLSWEGFHPWDYGTKCFASRSYPDLFGFYGDVIAAATLLGQFVTLIDSGAVGDANADIRQAALDSHLRDGLKRMPSAWRRDFAVFHMQRAGESLSAQFRLRVHRWRSGSWAVSAPEVGDESMMVAAGGSGKEHVEDSVRFWRYRTDVGGTSRAVFSAFCHSVASGKDSKSGGPVQVVGLGRIGPGRIIGFHDAGETYIGGLAYSQLSRDGIECYNALFERCDPATGQRIGQRQPPPRQISEVLDLDSQESPI